MTRLALFTMLFLAMGAPAQAQQGLLKFDSGAVLIYYSPGSLDRTTQVHDKLYGLVQSFAKWARSGVRPVGWVLTREDWKSSGRSRPYGFPEVVSAGQIALPALGDEGTIATWKGLLGGQLPIGMRTPMRGSPEESASLQASDNLGATELSRSLVQPGGIVPDEAWILDFAAHVQLIEASGGAATPGGTMFAGFYQMIERSQAEHAGPLAEFTTGIAFEKWLWYQAVLHRGARLVFAKDKRPMRKLLRQQAKVGGGRLTVGAILERYPEVGTWLGMLPTE